MSAAMSRVGARMWGIGSEKSGSRTNDEMTLALHPLTALSVTGRSGKAGCSIMSACRYSAEWYNRTTYTEVGVGVHRCRRTMSATTVRSPRALVELCGNRQCEGGRVCSCRLSVNEPHPACAHSPMRQELSAPRRRPQVAAWPNELPPRWCTE